MTDFRTEEQIKRESEARGVIDQISDFGSKAYYTAKDATLSVGQKIGEKMEQKGKGLKEGSQSERVDPQLEKAVQEKKDLIKGKIVDIKEKGEEKIDQAKEKVLTLGERLKETFVNAYCWIRDNFGSAYVTTKDFVAEYAEDVGHKVKHGYDVTVEKAGELTELGKEKLVETKEKAGELIDIGKEKLCEAGEFAKEKYHEGTEKVWELGEKAAEKFEHGREKAALKYEQGKEKIAETMEREKEKVEMFRDEAAERWEQGKQQAREEYKPTY
jgi:hypothetical protein